MNRALELAWRGWGRVQPNPMVGAVVLREGEIIAEGWHAEFSQPHAEVVALDQAGDETRGATLVVTLEPCRHQGNQPPCTQAIRRAGVRRVVFGAKDPNPEAAGGADELAVVGIEVEHLPFAGEVRRQNAVFFHAFFQSGGTRRPFVALKLATSVDGAIADRFGRSRWISGPEALAFVHWLRAGFDAIAVGGRTARADDPALTVRGPVTPRVFPARVVFSNSGNLDGAKQLLATAREVPVVVAGGQIAEERREALQEAGIDLLDAATPAEVLRGLAKRGIRSVLAEGGGRLAGALLGEGLVDRFYWIQSPVWLGEGAIPAFEGLAGIDLPDAARWHVAERRALGEDTLLVLEPE
jgi:diaminohydroxyphosphoribosylaminopyrimidine deaminase / 5-amino-6-(5-phosphoribosylamino)uracil reductase